MIKTKLFHGSALYSVDDQFNDWFKDNYKNMLEIIDIIYQTGSYKGCNNDNILLVYRVNPIVSYAKPELDGPWISVEDDIKPKDGQQYLTAYVYDGGDCECHYYATANYYDFDDDGPSFSNEGRNGVRVTHWMEFPKLPENSIGSCTDA